MNKIISISTLAGQFDSEDDLREYCNKQFQIIKTLTDENKNLKEEIEHLKVLMNSMVEPAKIIITKEQALLEEQIDIIQRRSIGQELSLEDTKKLDLLIKNLKLVKEQEKTFDGTPKKKFKTPPDKLLELASTLIVEPQDESS